MMYQGRGNRHEAVPAAFVVYRFTPAEAEMPGTDSAFHIPTGGWDSGTLLFCPLRG